MNETIGVIVPTYNCKEYLSDCLDSLLLQSHKPAQIVICDDCSQDGTQDVILEYQSRHPEIISSILHDKNLGIPANFNSGLRSINGDYISIVAGDDLWHKDKLKLEIKGLHENLECRWAYSDTVLIDKHGNIIGPFKRKYDGADGKIIFEVLTHQMTLRNWTIERSLLDSIGIFDEDLPIFEDWDFKIRLASKAKVVHIDNDSIYYRMHGEGISGSSGDVYFDNLLKIYFKHKTLINKQPKERVMLIKKYHMDDMSQQAGRFLKNSESRAGYKYFKYLAIKIFLEFYRVLLRLQSRKI